MTSRSQQRPSAPVANPSAVSSAPRGDEPRWLAYLLLLRAQWFQCALAGLAGGVLAAIATLLTPNLYRARASLILDTTSARIAATTEDGLAGGFAEVTIPTIEGLMAQPQIAKLAQQVIVFARSGAGQEAEAVNHRPEAGDPHGLEKRILAELPPEDRALMTTPAVEPLLEALPEELLKSIKTEPRIEKKLAFDVVYSPLLYASALADNPELARLQANLWVATFAVFYDQEVSRRQARQNLEFATAEHARADVLWRATQARLEKVLTEGELPVTEKLLEQRSEGLKITTAKLVDAERELLLKRRALLDTKLKIDAMSTGTAEWVGQASLDQSVIDELGPGLTQEEVREAVDLSGVLSVESEESDSLNWAAFLASAGLSERDLELYRQLRAESIRARAAFTTATSRLQQFEENSPLEEYELRKTDSVARFNEFMRSLRRLEIDVISVEAAIVSVADQLTSVSQTIELRRMLPVEVIYDITRLDAESSGATLRDGDGNYQDQVVNPTRTWLDQKLEELRAEQAQLNPKLVETRRALEETSDEIRELQRELSALRLLRRLLTDDQDTARVQYLAYLDRFNKLRLQLSELTTEVLSRQAEIKQLRARGDMAREIIAELYAKSLATKSQETILNSELQTQRDTVERLRERLVNLQALSEESQMVRVATVAVTPQEKVWPPRTLLTLAASIAAATAYLLFILASFEIRRFASGTGA